MTRPDTIIRRRAPKAPIVADETVYKFFATVPKGAESLAAAELKAIGATGITETAGGVNFDGGKETMYRANLWLRTASRVLLQLASFDAPTQEDLYKGVFAIPWENFLNSSKTIAVDANVKSSKINHSGFAALKTKDAIVDRLRGVYGSRPNVDTTSPDLRINLHLHRDRCTVSLDSSAEALDRRGYRLERNEAPMRETLAAAVIAITGWNGSSQLFDPMCGSGTIPVEAALFAANIPPGLNRSFGFERWLNYDRTMWRRLLEEAAAGVKKPEAGIIHASDTSASSIEIARRNAASAGIVDQLDLAVAQFEDFVPPAGGGIVIINPPYGYRLGNEEELHELYKLIGDILKQKCKGMTAFVLTGNPELAKSIGLKASRRHPLFNGAIECRLLRYDIY